MDKKHPDEIRTVVRKKYGEVAKSDSTGCCTPVSSCGGEPATPLDNLGTLIGYSQEELSVAPEGSNMGLGCGNPQAIADLKPGETVLDLGSGGGFDCFLAARQVGETGQVIGVDMTADMIAKARENALQGGYANVEFRLGEIEHLPVADASVDVIISNCVINLSPEKLDVFREAYRILKPGGRLAISDVLATAPLPAELKNDLQLLSACVSGAATVVEIKEMLQKTGFQDIQIQTRDESRQLIKEWGPEKNVQDYIVSASIEAVKPKE
jgi:SAM-dependent methyltransferase